jgi:hypothetical protein
MAQRVNVDFGEFIPHPSIHSIKASVCAWNESDIGYWVSLWCGRLACTAQARRLHGAGETPVPEQLTLLRLLNLTDRVILSD